MVLKSLQKKSFKMLKLNLQESWPYTLEHPQTFKFCKASEIEKEAHCCKKVDQILYDIVVPTF